ncbi:MAG: hypothetical protein ACM3OO_01305 [Planctomycetaceae bacterium]
MNDLPGAPQEHMDALLKFLVPFAQRQVDLYGGFAPFGASMAPDGELEVLTPGDGTTVEQQLEEVREHARDRAGDGSLLALGVCSEVDLPPGEFEEGIRVELEHRDADPITCVLPFRSTDDELTYGEIVALPGRRRTW